MGTPPFYPYYTIVYTYCQYIRPYKVLKIFGIILAVTKSGIVKEG